MKYKIPIKKFVEDDHTDIPILYQKLLAHHEEETKALIAEIERLESLVDRYKIYYDHYR